VTAPVPEPSSNPPFARFLTWAVVGAEHSPQQIVNRQVSNRYGTTETQLTETSEGWSLNVTTAVRGRARNETFTVNRNAYDSATLSGTFETRGVFYAWGFVWPVGLWAASGVGAWVYLYQPPAVLSVVSIAVLLVSPPFVSKAAVRGIWWAGRGLLNETRGRWVIAGLLWAFALAALIDLQVIVG
jgi:hypothetical protein